MDYRKFSKKELAGILDLIQSSVTCRTESDLVDMTVKIKELVCADHGVCGLGEVASGELAKIIKIVNLDYPVEWLKLYASEALFKKDPIIRYNYSFFKTHLWSEAMEVYRDEPYIDFMNKAGEFGLRHGVAGGILSEASRRGSIFSFSGPKDSFKGYHKEILDILTPHVHQALLRVCGDRPSALSELSQREKEVLRWMKEGKTNWEISMILNISERTVKFHVQNIERKLNAVNKAHAIAIAMDIGAVT